MVRVTVECVETQTGERSLARTGCVLYFHCGLVATTCASRRPEAPASPTPYSHTFRLSHEFGHSPRPLTHDGQRHQSHRPASYQPFARPAPCTARGRNRNAVSIWLRLHPLPRGSNPSHPRAGTMRRTDARDAMSSAARSAQGQIGSQPQYDQTSHPKSYRNRKHSGGTKGA